MCFALEGVSVLLEATSPSPTCAVLGSPVEFRSTFQCPKHPWTLAKVAVSIGLPFGQHYDCLHRGGKELSWWKLVPMPPGGLRLNEP